MSLLQTHLDRAEACASTAWAAQNYPKIGADIASRNRDQAQQYAAAALCFRPPLELKPALWATEPHHEVVHLDRYLNGFCPLCGAPQSSAEMETCDSDVYYEITGECGHAWEEVLSLVRVMVPDEQPDADE